MAQELFNPFASKRLIYRAIEPEEDEALFLSFHHDIPAYINSNYGLHRPQNKASAKRWIRDALEEALLAVVICLPPTSPDSKPTPIGQIALTGSKASTRHHRTTDIGIDIAKAYQGQGYGSEAIEWALGWAFDTAGMHRVSIHSFGFNVGATKLYERLGFRQESCLKESMFFNGAWWDEYGMAMLEREWRARKEVAVRGKSERNEG